MPSEAQCLHLAARLALRGQGRVEPGALVGCVLVKNDRIVGLGHHRAFGRAHAEREALDDCARRGEDPRGATVYCTLEPCAAQGKQPPCTEALIRAGVARVVFARADPHPAKGGGAAKLIAAGIECVESAASALARGVSAPFIKRITTNTPWVIAKWAQTIDGRIATRSGESKWISGDRSRRRVHRLRARVDAILTGIGTALADDPMLTARDVGAPRRRALRVVADSDLDLPLTSALARTARDAPTLLACHQELLDAPIVASKRRALEDLGVRLLGVPSARHSSAGSGRGIDLITLLHRLHADHAVSTLLVEAGPGLIGSMLEADLIDEAIVYVAPMMLGDELARSAAAGRVAESLSAAKRFDLWRAKALDGDVELTYRRRAERPAARLAGE